jgi:signal transduction histidine kinase
MFRHGLKSRYESEVHVGFMAIILILLCLNAVANFVLYRARDAVHDEAVVSVRQAARELSRAIQQQYPEAVPSDDLERIRRDHELKNLMLIPGKPDGLTKAAKRDWFRQVTRRFPPSEYPDLADRLYRADLLSLTRDKDRDYYYLCPISARAGGSLLVLTVELPTLAYLDDSRNLLLPVLVGAVSLAGLIYLLLYRFMFRPFRRLRAKVEEAGRKVSAEDDDVEAVVQEYESTIRQLTRTQEELLRLNEEIQGRADALELFNRCVMASRRSGVVTLSSDGRVVAINDTASRLLGLDSDAQPGAEYRRVLAACPELVKDIGRTLAGDSGEGYHEYSVQGSDRLVGVSLADIHGGEREFCGLLLMLSDLSELCRLRTELESRKRLAALGEMAGGLAHQVRNSLGAIGGYATLLKKKLARSEEPLGPVKALLDETEEAGELITKFLSFSRPISCSPQETDLVELIEETLAAFRVQPDLKAVELRFDRPEYPVTIECDRLLFKQSLSNIVDNAVKATHGEGRVTVRMEKEDNTVAISIGDSGRGITADELPKIFTPFFSSRPSGTGLGLPLAAKIVDLHHGSITVTSPPGEGALFRIELPAGPIGVDRRESASAEVI